jgi:hypothetical protein
MKIGINVPDQYPTMRLNTKKKHLASKPAFKLAFKPG